MKDLKKNRTREGFSGTCIKDTWTKPKGGRIKGGRWVWLGLEGVVGENGDNCTWTTIKKHRIPLEARGLKEMITSNFDPWLGPELEGKMIAIRQILGHMWFLNIDCIPENSIISIYM